MNNLVYFVIIAFVLYSLYNNSKIERFNDQTGRYCGGKTCEGKNYNQCLRCFDCGMVKDEYGNMRCVEGGYKGPYNYNVSQYCRTCNGRSDKECLDCYNCGLAIDKDGKSRCIGGNQDGPFNYETYDKWIHTDPSKQNKCKLRMTRWHHGDPYSYMMQRNASFGCCNGIGSSNKVMNI